MAKATNCRRPISITPKRSIVAGRCLRSEGGLKRRKLNSNSKFLTQHRWGASTQRKRPSLAGHQPFTRPLQTSKNSDHFSGIPRNESTESARDQQEEEDVHTTEMTQERTTDESAAVRSEGGGGGRRRTQSTARWPRPTAPSSKSGTA